MPEGPEIRRAAHNIAAAIEGQTLTQVDFAFETLKPYEKQLQGQRVDEVTSRSKAMLIHFANDLTLYSHNQLYGIWYIRPAGSYPKTQRQLRMALKTQSHWALLYSASEIAVLTSEALKMHPYLLKLGPDTLDFQLKEKDILARYQDKRFQRRRLTALLLDQGFLAGMGNYLRSEILYHAQIPPDYRPQDCSLKQLKALAKASLLLPRQSLETGGITNDLNRVKRLKTKDKTYAQYRFCVFARKGQPCYRCKTPIEKIQANGRRLYYCPQCQQN